MNNRSGQLDAHDMAAANTAVGKTVKWVERGYGPNSIRMIFTDGSTLSFYASPSGFTHGEKLVVSHTEAMPRVGIPESQDRVPDATLSDFLGKPEEERTLTLAEFLQTPLAEQNAATWEVTGEYLTYRDHAGKVIGTSQGTPPEQIEKHDSGNA